MCDAAKILDWRAPPVVFTTAAIAKNLLFNSTNIFVLWLPKQRTQVSYEIFSVFFEPIRRFGLENNRPGAFHLHCACDGGGRIRISASEGSRRYSLLSLNTALEKLIEKLTFRKLTDGLNSDCPIAVWNLVVIRPGQIKYNNVPKQLKSEVKATSVFGP